ncbi:hypothetical protein T440DRAFT_154870 [Plenodomus tracheiphilus IPT5]|uniref:Uncharacterized protein n=1 Tax=Plenodomus tracheiphilus IPT5 TaxID=1408161 RepID=A0A6A7BIV5_9PLEO|nr:hypothetical protein T440DRAFT_154870 [Plenodomus tracheiphilus IPT5]
MTDNGKASTTRKARSEIALKQITKLQSRRAVPAGGLARGNFPSGQMIQRAPRPQVDEFGFLAEDGASASQGRSTPLRITRAPVGPAEPRGDAPPGGRMVRAPAQFRTTPNDRRSPPGVGPRGPNLRGRDGGPRAGPGGARGGARGGPRKADEGGPKKREKQAGGGAGPQKTTLAEIDPATTLSDGMVHHLLRLQGKEWDRVQYEPKYAQGSFAANELIHAGRELFKGESPPVKIWGPLEKRIGVVGMFGAHATLKIRRVKDGDAAPFGQEEPEEEAVAAVQ